jgi:HAD superfamily hydrolase (TIGR01509 family)
VALPVSDLELTIFDCDGVLARLLTEVGLPTTLVEARRDYQGLLLADVLTAAQARLGRALPEGWLDRFERERARAFCDELQPIAGVARSVERISEAGVAVCVASQGKLEKIRLSLQLTHLRSHFDDCALFSAYSVPRGKPHPDLFLHAAREMGVDPSACVVVEDTPSGVTAAVSAGMRVLGYAADSDEQALRSAGAKTFESFDELSQLLGL